MSKISKKIYLSSMLCLSFFLTADNFSFNTSNNHGSIGLINMPSARFHDESSYRFVLYDGTPDQKISFIAAPYDWLEASVFYTNIQGKPYPGYEKYQDFKDKGFNLKVRLKKEDNLPALAIGINDLAGTGLYSSEYLVASYGVGNFDFHAGIGWGNMDGFQDFSNPLTKISDRFLSRPDKTKDQGGSIDIDRFFSGNTASPFFGISYLLNRKTIVKFERDNTVKDESIDFEKNEIDYSFGIDYLLTENFTIGAAFERGNYFSLRFSFKGSNKDKPPYRYKSRDNISENKYDNFRNLLNANGIGVNSIEEGDNQIGVEITQFSHPSIEVIEEIIMSAKKDSGIEKDIVANKKIADLNVIEEFDSSFNGTLIYQRPKKRGFNSSTNLSLRPFIAGREGFLKVAALVENNNEYIIRDNFFFSSNLKYSIWDNFDDLTIPPPDTYPAQVRSDVKDYLRNFDKGVIVGRAQFDFYKTIKRNHHIMFTGGILEEMFSGYGIEYLWFDPSRNYAMGFEVFDVTKRDYKLRFGTLDYENITGHLNFYYRNYYAIPFDAKISIGEYLAGDFGSTFELSRTFKSGIKFGIFATNTDVSAEQFGEGSFDKGIFFDIPIFGNLINYSWRPLTKDPGQKLIRKNSLHDLLIKFK